MNTKEGPQTLSENPSPAEAAIAKALYRTQPIYDCTGKPVRWEEISPLNRSYFIQSAQVAINALVEEGYFQAV